ncbi:MAG: DUF5131 family protein [Cyanobacteriota bacterium]
MTSIEWTDRTWNVVTGCDKVSPGCAKNYATGNRNSMWKGGRSIASNGYVLIRVGTKHHLADTRGYAYEHRLVAEERLGRRLYPNEQVHHRNGDKQDNHPDNLEVLTFLEHQLQHRKNTSQRRLPSEQNFFVSCHCGCGQVFEKFDANGRPRKYISGHNPSEAETQSAILAVLRSGSMARQEIAQKIQKPVGRIATALTKLKKKNLVRQIKRGVWEISSND